MERTAVWQTLMGKVMGGMRTKYSVKKTAVVKEEAQSKDMEKMPSKRRFHCRVVVVGDDAGDEDGDEGMLGVVGCEKEGGEEGWTRGLATKEGKAKNRRGMIFFLFVGMKERVFLVSFP